jgi:hypothetical protein
MIVRLTFKTPDVTDAIPELLHPHCAAHEEYDFGCGECASHKFYAEDEIQIFKMKLGKFIKYGEYVTIEFDTEKGTATVVPL